MHYLSTPNMSAYNQKIIEQTISQQNLVSMEDLVEVPRARKKSMIVWCPLLHSITFYFSEHGRRPKSFVETSRPWNIQQNPNHYKSRREFKKERRSEDSGNSTLSTQASYRRDWTAKNQDLFIMSFFLINSNCLFPRLGGPSPTVFFLSQFGAQIF